MGDPAATQQCSLEQFRTGFVNEAVNSVGLGGKFLESCPEASQLGIAEVHFGAFGYWPEVYNLVPQQGYPAEFGFRALEGDPGRSSIPRVRTGGDDGIDRRAFCGRPRLRSR